MDINKQFTIILKDVAEAHGLRQFTADVDMMSPLDGYSVRVGFYKTIKVDPAKPCESFLKALLESFEDSLSVENHKARIEKLERQIKELEKYKEYYDMHYAMMNGKLK